MGITSSLFVQTIVASETLTVDSIQSITTNCTNSTKLLVQAGDNKRYFKQIDRQEAKAVWK